METFNDKMFFGMLKIRIAISLKSQNTTCLTGRFLRKIPKLEKRSSSISVSTDSCSSSNNTWEII